MGQPEEEVCAKTRKKRRDKGRNPERVVSWKPRERVFPGGSSHGSLMLQTNQVRCRSNTSTNFINNEAVGNLDEHHQGRVIKEGTRGGDDSGSLVVSGKKVLRCILSHLILTTALQHRP